MIKNLLFAAAFIAALTSCGGNAPGELTEASGSIDAASMKAVIAGSGGPVSIASLKTSMKIDAGTVSPPFTLPSGMGFTNDEYTACTTTTGSTTDADGDGIAKGFRSTFDCNNVAMQTGNGTLTRVGYYEEADRDDTKVGWLGGFTTKFEFDSAYDFSHEYGSYVWAGSWDAQTTATSIAMDYGFTISSTNAVRATGTESTIEYQTQWKQAYLFDNATTPWMKGTMSLDGFFRLKGSIDYHNEVHDVAVVFKVTTDHLLYDRTACPTGFFKSGSMSYTDGSGNVLKYSYNNCVETETFNGAPLP